jgi:holo-[acyl-carrier protein] synthase
MKILGIGLDLIDLDRFQRLYGNSDTAAIGRCFTAGEQAGIGAGSDSLSSLAVRFAAKEAVLKTIGGLQDGIALTDIEVLSDGMNQPTVSVSGGALAAAKVRGISGWQISLSHDVRSAAAVALAYSDET